MKNRCERDENKMEQKGWHIFRQMWVGLLNLRQKGNVIKLECCQSNQKKISLNKSWVNVLVEGDKKPTSINCDKVVR